MPQNLNKSPLDYIDKPSFCESNKFKGKIEGSIVELYGASGAT